MNSKSGLVVSSLIWSYFFRIQWLTRRMIQFHNRQVFLLTVSKINMTSLFMVCPGLQARDLVLWRWHKQLRQHRCVIQGQWSFRKNIQCIFYFKRYKQKSFTRLHNYKILLIIACTKNIKRYTVNSNIWIHSF